MSAHYDLVNSFSLFVPLGISWSGRILVCDSQLTEISSKGFVVELKSIVRDEGMRYFEAGDNVLLDKLLYIHISDIRQRLSFNPFGEIVCADQQIFLISRCFGKWANNIQTPLCKRPSTGEEIQESSWLVCVLCKSLTLIAFLRIF